MFGKFLRSFISTSLSINCYSCNIFSVNLFFIPIRFQAKITDNRGRFKRPLNINMHYSHTLVLGKKDFENCQYMLRKLPFHARPKYMEDPVCYYILFLNFRHLLLAIYGQLWHAKGQAVIFHLNFHLSCNIGINPPFLTAEKPADN